MIKSVTVINHLGESIRLELSNPWDSGFVIKEIDGLGPVKANVNFTELATVDGAIDNSARLESRNIVLSLLFLENPTIEATRLLSYKYFPTKRIITLVVETDSRICEVSGRVESNDPSIFSKKEGCKISILCGDPYFYSKKIYRTTFYGVDPLFEFPFENPDIGERITHSDPLLDFENSEILDSDGDPIGDLSIENVEAEKMIEFGQIKVRTDANIYYEGDLPIGITLKIHAIGEAKGITIYNTGTREIMQIDDTKLESIMGSGIKAGDDITISTVRGNKGITMTRNGITTNIINVLGRPVQWFQLSKGDNVFTVVVEEGLQNLLFYIENRIIYEGV